MRKIKTKLFIWAYARLKPDTNTRKKISEGKKQENKWKIYIARRWEKHNERIDNNYKER